MRSRCAFLVLVVAAMTILGCRGASIHHDTALRIALVGESYTSLKAPLGGRPRAIRFEDDALIVELKHGSRLERARDLEDALDELDAAMAERIAGARAGLSWARQQVGKDRTEMRQQPDWTTRPFKAGRPEWNHGVYVGSTLGLD